MALRATWAILKDLTTRDPELALAQHDALAPSLPLLYLILTSNALLLAVTHARTAPALLTMGLPGLFVVVSIAKTVQWSRRRREAVSGAVALRRLRVTTWVAAVFSLVVTVWALALYPYGDAFAQCHVAFYMSITVVSCLFLLRHAPLAALATTLTVVLPFAGFFLASGHLVLQMLAVNLVTVAVGVTITLRAQFLDFRSLIGSRRELIERQARLEQLNGENQALAHVDSLTGLPNRRRFMSVLDERLEVAAAAGTRLAVLLLDLDGFKAVNDVYGHTAGDALLAEAGRRLLALGHGSAIFARLGGDEFGAVLAGDPSDEAIASFGQLVCATVHGRYLGSQINVEVGGSAGIVAYPDGATSAELLFERADYALYHAKQTSRGHAVLFSSEHERMMRDAGRLAHALRQADVATEMGLAFQPIMDAVAGRVVGYEALARWTSPRIGPVPPDRFIPAAERLNLIGPLTVALLRKALAAAARWEPHLRIGFNLSALDLTSPETLDGIVAVIEASGVDPTRIDLEVTETTAMRDFAQAVAALERLRGTGAQIALDDFGTGYSSLSHVHQLRPDKIKIDRSFVADVLTSQRSRDIVRTSVELCRSLGSVCVVEGVETLEQARALRRLGCRLMQGYYYGRPSFGPQVVAARLQEVEPAA